jgi:hypothetical protein
MAVLTRRLVATVAVLAGALALLLLAGARLPGPVVPVLQGQPPRWGGPSTPADLVAGVVHAATVVMTGYLMVAAVLELACTAIPRRRGRRVPRIRLPVGTAAIARIAGTGLALSVTVLPAAAGAEPAPVVMHVLAPPSTDPPVLHRLGAGAPDRAARAHTALGPSSGAADEVWVIRPGDDLWQVACTTLAVRSRRPVPDAAVAEYLDRLVARNADVLVVRGHPELVYPGQRFVLPAIT